MREFKYDVRQTKGFDAVGVIRRMRHNAAALTSETLGVIETTATARAPFRTGALKASISKRHSEGSQSGSVHVEAFYGIYVNYGTRHMRAQPFFSGAVNTGRVFMKANLGRIVS